MAWLTFMMCSIKFYYQSTSRMTYTARNRSSLKQTLASEKHFYGHYANKKNYISTYTRSRENNLGHAFCISYTRKKEESHKSEN